ncbi:hypothetical protein Acr_15g0006020 [Actinidia rufa]|uniref:Uncharacterized protein n=1 Tax=Actinidia rufa TaxID=165716 RepID=A0A7J0FTI2_9ERIC|nr:hypothetical protein Acr_15g0006020 [Actinidia rufa]
MHEAMLYSLLAEANAHAHALHHSVRACQRPRAARDAGVLRRPDDPLINDDLPCMDNARRHSPANPSSLFTFEQITTAKPASLCRRSSL